jgi:hypothetical protein
MTFFPLLKHKPWVKTLATHVADIMTVEVVSNTAASLIDTLISKINQEK